MFGKESRRQVMPPCSAIGDCTRTQDPSNSVRKEEEICCRDVSSFQELPIAVRGAEFSPGHDVKLPTLHVFSSLNRFIGLKKSYYTVNAISTRRQLFDLPDEMATKINIEFYADATDALLKARMNVFLTAQTDTS